MDYEFRLKVAERELAHVREMQALVREHLDITDERMARMALHESRMEHLESELDRLTANVNRLVEALLREHPNGKQGQD